MLTYRDALRDGFRLINRIWQLVVMQLVAVIVYGVSFFLIVVLPVVIAAPAIGIDAGKLAGIEGIVRNLGDYLTQYFGLVLAGIFLFIVYLLVISVIAVFMYGASSGLIAYSIRNPSERFSLKRFFGEGMRLFFPMLWYLTVAGLLLMAVAVVSALIFVAASGFLGHLKNAGNALSYFMGIFILLLSVSVVMLVVTFAFAAVIYGTAILIFRGKGAIASIRDAVVYLYNRQSAYWLYCLLLAGLVAVMTVMTLMSISIGNMGATGYLLYIPYQLFTYIVQTYLGLIIIAAVFVYYYSDTFNAALSIQQKDTSSQGDPGQDGTPPQ